LCIWYGLYATPKHHNHNLACGLIFGDLLNDDVFDFHVDGVWLMCGI